MWPRNSFNALPYFVTHTIDNAHFAICVCFHGFIKWEWQARMLNKIHSASVLSIENRAKQTPSSTQWPQQANPTRLFQNKLFILACGKNIFENSVISCYLRHYLWWYDICVLLFIGITVCTKNENKLDFVALFYTVHALFFTFQAMHKFPFLRYHYISIIILLLLSLWNCIARIFEQLCWKWLRMKREE